MFYNYFGMFGGKNSKGSESANSPIGGSSMECLRESRLPALGQMTHSP